MTLEDLAKRAGNYRSGGFGKAFARAIFASWLVARKKERKKYS